VEDKKCCCSVESIVGRPISEIETPALVVDLDIMESNMDKMMQFLKDAGAGVGIRPHAKTHKTPEIAMMQMKKGALGICCAKLGEAEAMAEGGVPDILIANQTIGEKKIQRLAALSKKTDLKAAVDTKENLLDISKASAAVGGRVGIVVEVDSGNHRGGVRTHADAIELVKMASTLPGVYYAGLMGYEGHAVFLPSLGERQEAAEKSYDILLGYRDAVKKATGLDSGIVTAAGSGTYMFGGKREGLTDIEAGSYIFMDARYGGTAGVDFRNSLAVLSTIASHPEPDLYICDAGIKSMTEEFGLVSTLPSYGLKVVSMSEEHVNLRATDEPTVLPGIADLDAKYGKTAPKPLKVGDKIMLIPSHCCTTVNLHDVMYAVRNGKVEHVWRVAGRGKFA
jgi:D-serine deaminase-like pyridoxal phosphate-dependent protein